MPAPASTSASAGAATDSITSFASSSSCEPPREIDYVPLPLDTYEARWGPYDARHMASAIGQLREQVHFDHAFLHKHLRLTDDELRVLDILEMCIANPRPYWVSQGRRRPYVDSRPGHRSSTPEVAEHWEFCTTTDGARQEQTLRYHKNWHKDQDGRPAVTYWGQVVLEDRAGEPWDDVDMANAFSDYVHTDAFADTHGGLSEFESRTVELVRRDVVWLSHTKAMLKWAAGAPRGTLVGTGNRRAGKRKAVAEERRNPFAVVV